MRPFSLCTIISRHFSSSSAVRKYGEPLGFSKIPSKYRPQAVQVAQKVLTDYLHTTRSLPFTYAEHISKNSFYSLSDIVCKFQFSIPSFHKSLQRFLRYHPINEFEFFYESIGINYAELNGFLHPQKFFICEDSRVFDVACALSGFGFPWNLLGKLYREEISIFSKDPDELSRMLHGFKDCGFSTVTIIGICLVFPSVLVGEPKLGGEMDALFDDLRKVLIDFDLVSLVEGNVQTWVEVCRKIRLFYDLGCQKGKMGELMGKRKDIFVKYQEDVFVYKAEFFSRLSVDKDRVGMLLLEKPEILDMDLESPLISVLGLLEHFGMNQMELESIAKKYPYVLGRNKMVNLPEVMRALDLQGWFFNQMRTGKHLLLDTYVIDSFNENMDNDYKASLDIIQSSRTPVHTFNKLNFLHSIGFGENYLTIKVLEHLHGTSTDLQRRFDCLLHAGIQFSKLCKMVQVTPKILNQNQQILEKKMKFLCEDIGSSLDYLDVFPAFLCFELDKRIKPRYKFHMWLIEKGLSAKRYSLASMIATSEKNFLARISGIHPATAKHWLECFSNQNHK